MYRLFLSYRYFRSRWINLIPVICMALGVMALIVIMAVMDGFQAQLKTTLRGTLSDLILSVHYESDFEEWEEILHGIDGVDAVSPHLESFALVAQIPEDERFVPQMDGAWVKGIDPQREAEVSGFRDYLLYREKDPRTNLELPREELTISTPDPERPFAVLDPRWEDRPGVILGRPLADRLRVYKPRKRVAEDGTVLWSYDRVYLTTMVKREGEREFRPEQWDFPVTGIYQSGYHELDQHIAFLDRSVARKFFQLAADPQEIRIKLADYSRADEVIAQLDAKKIEIYSQTAVKKQPWQSPFPPFVVHTWEWHRRNFLSAIENEKGLIAIIAGMAFVVTGFMIFSILSMIVTMKTRDIGILKAVGATTQGVLRIFILNGLLVGAIGATVGLSLGLLFVRYINEVKEFMNKRFGWEAFPEQIYQFREIPTRVIPEEAAAVTLMAFAVALLGAILPALRAARLDPVESLRYE